VDANGWIVMLNIVNVKATSWCQGEGFISHDGSELGVIVPLSLILLLFCYGNELLHVISLSSCICLFPSEVIP
jgi:hypothetical protein